jgi:hypothetical protein
MPAERPPIAPQRDQRLASNPPPGDAAAPSGAGKPETSGAAAGGAGKSRPATARSTGPGRRRNMVRIGALWPQ